jgi:hypothetical protein
MIFNYCRAASLFLSLRNVFLFDVARRQSIEERWRRRRWAITVFDTASSWQDMILTFYAIESFLIPSAEFWPVIL